MLFVRQDYATMPSIKRWHSVTIESRLRSLHSHFYDTRSLLFPAIQRMVERAYSATNVRPSVSVRVRDCVSNKWTSSSGVSNLHLSFSGGGINGDKYYVQLDSILHTSSSYYPNLAPSAHGELLWSVTVRRASCGVNIQLTRYLVGSIVVTCR